MAYTKGPWIGLVRNLSRKFQLKFRRKFRLEMPRGTCIYGITVASKEQGPVIDKTTTVRPQNGLSRSDFEISVAQDLWFAFL